MQLRDLAHMVQLQLDPMHPTPNRDHKQESHRINPIHSRRRHSTHSLKMILQVDILRPRIRTSYVSLKHSARCISITPSELMWIHSFLGTG
jgi:hypothetical protein